MTDPQPDEDSEPADAPDPTSDDLLDSEASVLPRPVYNRAGGTGGKLPD